MPCSGFTDHTEVVCDVHKSPACGSHPSGPAYPAVKTSVHTIVGPHGASTHHTAAFTLVPIVLAHITQGVPVTGAGVKYTPRHPNMCASLGVNKSFTRILDQEFTPAEV